MQLESKLDINYDLPSLSMIQNLEIPQSIVYKHNGHKQCTKALNLSLCRNFHNDLLDSQIILIMSLIGQTPTHRESLHKDSKQYPAIQQRKKLSGVTISCMTEI